MKILTKSLHDYLLYIKYNSYIIRRRKMRKDNLKKFAVALTKENKRKEEVIETLEEIIDEIKGEE